MQILKRLAGHDERGDLCKVLVELALFESEILRLSADGRAVDIKVEVIINEFLRGDGDLRCLKTAMEQATPKAVGGGRG